MPDFLNMWEDTVLMFEYRFKYGIGNALITLDEVIHMSILFKM